LAELDLLASIVAQDRTSEPAADAGNEGAVSDELLGLVRRMSAGGLRITHDFIDLSSEEPAIGQTAYRVVQEALTNALRHAPHSAVTITTVKDNAAIEIRVTNDASAALTGAAPPESGFGLIGLAERVRSLGGTLSAGPDGDGGFMVAARLPLPDPDRVEAAR
jgi:signal transduction histidine kinase